MADIVPCPHCKTRIIPTTTGNCPSCGKRLDEPVQAKLDPTLSPAVLAARNAAVEDKKRTTGKPIFIGLIVALIGWALFMSARQIEAGVTVEHTGRHSAKAHVLDEIAKALGSTGCLVLWLGGVGVCGLWYVLARKADQAKKARERPETDAKTGA